jgi:hypothetical protein
MKQSMGGRIPTLPGLAAPPTLPGLDDEDWFVLNA